MSISILEILSLAPPMGVGAGQSAYGIFYAEAEDLTTSATNRNSEVISLYDIILSDIDASQLSNSKGTKTEFTTAYESGKTFAENQNVTYYLGIVDFVQKLQTITVDSYGTLDIFYDVESITVSQIFADISEDAGYPVSPQYIEDIS